MRIGVVFPQTRVLERPALDCMCGWFRANQRVTASPRSAA